MGVSYNPRLVSDGMVLCFDPANQNTYPTNNPENLVLWSNDFSRNVWSGFCGSKRNLVYNTNDVLAPDGNYTATKVIRTSATCGGGDSNEVSWGFVWASGVGGSIVGTGQTYTASLYVRGVNGGESIVFGLDDANASLFTLTTSWQRLTYTGVVTQDPPGYRGIELYVYNVGQGCYFWGPQVETGSTATTYTPTTTSPIRRTFRDLNSGSSSTLISSYGLNTTAYGVPVLEINNNGSISNGQVQVNTQVDLDYLARSQNFTVMFAAKKNFYGISGNNNGNSQLFQGVSSGYTTGWRILEGSGGTPGNAFTSNHYFGIGYNDINTSLYLNDSGSVNRMCIVAFTVSATTIFGFVNGNTNSRSNPGTYASGTSTPRISFTGAGAGSFNGLLGYFAIYNRALSQTEIEQNYAVLRTRYGI